MSYELFGMFQLHWKDVFGSLFCERNQVVERRTCRKYPGFHKIITALGDLPCIDAFYPIFIRQIRPFIKPEFLSTYRLR